MHCQTGRYITMGPNDASHASLQPTDDSNQLFVLEKSGEGDFRLRNIKYNVYLTYFGSWKYLGGYSSTVYQDQHWGAEIADKNAGFHLFNRLSSLGGNNHLFFKDNAFGLYGGDYPDQLWVLQLETTS